MAGSVRGRGDKSETGWVLSTEGLLHPVLLSAPHEVTTQVFKTLSAGNVGYRGNGS